MAVSEETGGRELDRQLGVLAVALYAGSEDLLASGGIQERFTWGRRHRLSVSGLGRHHGLRHGDVVGGDDRRGRQSRPAVVAWHGDDLPGEQISLDDGRQFDVLGFSVLSAPVTGLGLFSFRSLTLACCSGRLFLVSVFSPAPGHVRGTLNLGLHHLCLGLVVQVGHHLLRVPDTVVQPQTGIVHPGRNFFLSSLLNFLTLCALVSHGTDLQPPGKQFVKVRLLHFLCLLQFNFLQLGKHRAVRQKLGAAGQAGIVLQPGPGGRTAPVSRGLARGRPGELESSRHGCEEGPG